MDTTTAQDTVMPQDRASFQLKVTSQLRATLAMTTMELLHMSHIEDTELVFYLTLALETATLHSAVTVASMLATDYMVLEAATLDTDTQATMVIPAIALATSHTMDVPAMEATAAQATED